MLPLLTVRGFKVNYCSYPFIPMSGAGLPASACPPTTRLFIHIVVLVWVYLVATNGRATQAPDPLRGLTTCAVATLLFH